MKQVNRFGHILSSVLRAAFSRNMRILVWYGIPLFLGSTLLDLHGFDPSAFAGFLPSAPRRLHAGEPRLLVPCGCLVLDDVGCRCRCHARQPVTSPETALLAFEAFDAVHHPFGRIASTADADAVMLRVRGRRVTAGFRVFVHRPEDAGERCRGVDFVFGSPFAVSCWETPERFASGSGHEFLSDVLDRRLAAVVARHLRLPGDADYEAARGDTNATVYALRPQKEGT